jgi:hypothetical protein
MKLVIGFGKPKGGFKPLAWAIQWFSGTDYSHTYFRFQNAGLDLIFQVTTSGSNYIAATDFQKTYEILEEYEFQLNGDESQIFLQFCDRNKNIQYSYLQLMGIAAAIMLDLQRSPCRHEDKKENKTAICAEILLRLMQLMPDVFIGIEQIKICPELVDLKTVHDFVAQVPTGKKI